MTEKVSIAEGNRRLLVLAKKLDATPRARFDFAKWVGDDWKGKQDLSCGTTACGLGLAASMPTLRKFGLRLDRVKTGNARVGYVRIFRGERAGSVWDAPNVSTRAAAAVFRLDIDEVSRLFIPSDHAGGQLPFRATPKQLARHIRRFVATRTEATP